jgi:arylsulfatase A
MEHSSALPDLRPRPRRPVRTPHAVLHWLLLLLAGFAFHASLAAARPPNVVVILADDLGWGDLGCYQRDSKIPTPHLDRMAAQGIRFTDAHSPSAVCTPTRYALLTGRYAWRTRLKRGVLHGFSAPLLEPGRETVASLLRRRGYQTAGIGKWHLGLGWPAQSIAGAVTSRTALDFGDEGKPVGDLSQIDWHGRFLAGPLTAGFDHFFGIPASLDMEPYVYVEDDRVVRAPDHQAAGDRSQRQGGGGFWRPGPAPAGFHPREVLPVLTQHATDWIRRQPKERPFFLYFPLTAPHDPWVPTAEFHGRSGAGTFGDFVAMVDDTVGQVLAALDTAGVAEETLVLFTSDNGAHWKPEDIQLWGHRANAGWRGMKSDAFEGGHRVPLLARWPGRIRPGTVSDALVGLVDLTATVAEAAGVSLPTGVAPDSQSFLPVLLGRRRAVRDTLIMHSANGVFALRQGPWKYIESPGSGGWTSAQSGTSGQLYRLDTDPAEQTNRFTLEPARVAALQALLERERTRPTR